MTTRCARWYLIIPCFVLALACTRQPSPAYSQPSGGGGSLEQLVAPIALYPDPLVAQILPASTNPMEVMEAADAIANGARPSETTASQWSPAIQALVSYPTVLKMMNDRIEWTTKLGQAVTANQGSVLAALQQVRTQAQSAGNLVTTPQQVVTTQGSNIIIMPANPEVIYVPQYNPVAILAPAPYYAYAPLMTFGVGFAAGAATAYACDWGYHGYGSITVNNSYHYSYTNNYSGSGSYYYSGSSGSYSAYHPQSATYTGYNARTGTYGAYNPSTGKYGTYNPSTGEYNRNGTTGYRPPPSDSYHASGSSSGYHGYGSTSAWGDHSSWGSGGGSGGDAFHGLGGGGWGAQDASNRGFGSWGGRSDGGGWGGGGGGFDRGGGWGGGGWGGGRGFGGGGFGGFRGGGFGGRR